MYEKMKKYEKVFRNLETAINQGIYQVNDYLPTEEELAKEYAVSRDTIRKALKLLAEHGLIQKRQGSGSQIIKHERINFPVSALTSFQEIAQAQGMATTTNVIAIDKLIVDGKLSELTGFPPKSHVWRITRQRVMEGVASVLDIDYLLTTFVPEIDRSIAEKSIYDYLENHLHLMIDLAEKEITIDQTNQQDSILLDLAGEHHVVSIKSKVFLTNGQQFQFTESRHKLDKFRFVDFAKRRPAN